MAARKFVHVALKVFSADLVVNALLRPLEHRPKRLDPIGMSHPVNVLANAVTHARVVEGHALIGFGVVGVDGGASDRGGNNESLQRLGVGPFCDLGSYLVGLAILGTDNGGLADCAPASLDLLTLVLIALLAAHIGFVYFNWTRKSLKIIAVPRLANALEHVPRTRLRDAYVPMQFHAGYALEAR